MTKKRIIAVFIMLIAGLSAFRIVSLNLKYPPSALEARKIDESIIYKDQFEITVTKCAFMKNDMIESYFKDEIELGRDVKCLVVDITIKNISDQAGQIEVNSFILETGAWGNAINLTAFLQLNEDNDNVTLVPTLKAGEEISMKLPFSMISQHFKENQWGHVESREYFLTVNLYPVKQRIQLYCGS